MINKDLYQTEVNGRYQQKLTRTDIERLDWIKRSSNTYHIIEGGTGYRVELLSVDINNKEVQLRVDGKKMTVKISDAYDLLVQKMGLSLGVSQKVNEIKAPMPGLVLQVAVEEGQHITAGDTLLILEAMKMENIIKAPNDAVIQKIHVAAQDTVEKNQLMIEME